jgi:hypothetical protein
LELLEDFEVPALGWGDLVGSDEWQGVAPS